VELTATLENGKRHPLNKAIKWVGIVVPLCMVMVGCSVDSVETRQRDAVHRLDKVLALRQKGIDLGAPWANSDPADIPQDVLKQLKSDEEQIVEESKAISIEALDQVYPRLGMTFKQTFVRSLALHLEAQTEYMASKAKGQPYSSESDQKVNEAEALRQEWAKWFEPRTHEIAEAMRAKW
jgi:hypothetical protein